MNEILSRSCSDQVSLWVLNVIVHTTALAAVSLLLARSYRRAAAMRYWLLCFGLMMVFASPGISALIQATGSSWLTIASEPAGWAELTSANTNAKSTLVDEFDLDRVPSGDSKVGQPQALPNDSPLSDPVTTAVAVPPAPVPNQPSESIGWWRSMLRFVVMPLIVMWGIGTTILLLRMSVSWFRMCRILRFANSIENSRLQAAFERACLIAGCGNRRPQLVVSEFVSGPIAAGVIRGKVVLPASLLDQVEPNSLADVLVHEVAHVVRRDQIVVLLQNIVAAIYWPHPLISKLNCELAKAREEVCDNFVLAGTDAPVYSRTLLSLAQLLHQTEAMPGCVGFFTDRWKLENRIAGLLDAHRNRTTFLNTRGWLFVVAFTLVLCASMLLGTITIVSAQVAEEPALLPQQRSPKNSSASVSGRVLDPSGKPMIASLWIGGPARSGGFSTTPVSITWTAVGKSAVDGRFEIAIPKSENGSANSERLQVRLAATADGLGFAWADVKTNRATNDLTLRLVDDTPIRGRIMTLDGLPVENVQLDVVEITAPESLPSSSELIKNAKLSSGVYTNWPSWPGGSPLTKPVVTDKEGGFQLAGLGSERWVRLQALGDGQAATRLLVITREKPSDSANGAIAVRRDLSESTYFTNFTHVAVPERIVRGTVVDHETGKPIPSVKVVASSSWASRKQPSVTDESGKFIIRYVPKATEYMLEFSPTGATHLRAKVRLSDSAGGESLDTNITLAKGVKLRGRVVDEVTGKGVQGEIVYNALFPNEFIKILGDDSAANPLSTVQSDDDGHFELAVLPGIGAISARVKGDEYASALFRESDLRKIFPKGDLDVTPGESGQIRFLRTDSGLGRRGVMPLSMVHAVEPLNLKQDGQASEITLSLRRSVSLQGEIVDEQGKPVTGVTVVGLSPTSTSREPLETNKFEVTGLPPETKRSLLFLQQDRSLGAKVSVDGNQKGLVRVELKPTGSISGTVVDVDGDPIANGYVAVEYKEISFATDIRDGLLDEKGRFTVKHLLAGQEFELHLHTTTENQLDVELPTDFRMQPGEHVELGIFRQKNQFKFEASKMEAAK